MDSTDLLPTLQKLVTGHVQEGLDGTVMVPAIRSASAFGANPPGTVQWLSLLEKRINAPVGPFGIAALRISTLAAISGDSHLNQELSDLVSERQQINRRLHSLIRSADNGQTLPAGEVKQVISSARKLLAAVGSLEQSTMPR